MTDEQILAEVSATENNRTFFIGKRVHHIAARLGLKKDRHAYLHRRLRRLEAQGLVVRHPRYSYPNSIYWTTPEALAAEGIS
jgi:DNA-binding HxlR family transcriptional regulator